MENLWPDVKLGEILEPALILSEQATLLSQKTEGHVSALLDLVGLSGGEYRYYFRIFAQELNNFNVNIFEFSFSDPGYPVVINLFSSIAIEIGKESFECNDRDEFIESVRKILSTRKVMRTISGLWAISEERRAIHASINR